MKRYFLLAALSAISIVGIILLSAPNRIKARGFDNRTAWNNGQTGFSAWNVKFESYGDQIKGSIDYEVYDRSNRSAIVQLFIAIEREIVVVLYNGIPGYGRIRNSQTFSFSYDQPHHGKIVNIYLAGTWAIGIQRGKFHYEHENGGWRCAIGEISLIEEQENSEPELLMLPPYENGIFSIYTFQLNPAAVDLMAKDYYKAEQYVRKMIWVIADDKFQGAHESVLIAIAGSIAKHSMELYSNAGNYRNQYLQMQISVDNNAVALVKGLSSIASVLSNILNSMNILHASHMIRFVPNIAKRII